MSFRMIRLALAAGALALAASSPVIAQGVETRGVVQRVDVPSGTVYFTDGRTARIEPGSTLTVDGRPVSLADVQPGWTLIIPGVAAAAPPSVVVAAPTPARPARPPVDATGVVSRVDPQTGTIVLEDGRVLQATGLTTIIVRDPVVCPAGDRYMTWDDLVALGRERLAADPDEITARVAAIKPGDPLALLYTSGTTGNPKGVVLTHRNILYEMAAAEMRGAA